jgi:hypothetical protein
MSSALWGNPEQVHPGLVKKRLCSVKEALIKSELPWAITVNYLKTHVLA